MITGQEGKLAADYADDADGQPICVIRVICG